MFVVLVELSSSNKGLPFASDTFVCCVCEKSSNPLIREIREKCINNQRQHGTNI